VTDLDIAAFDHLPEPPGETLSGPLVLVRLVDGIAFRYRWASDGLTAEALGFRPCEGAMSVGELLDHLRFLARWLHVNVARARAGEEPPFAGPGGSLDTVRRRQAVVVLRVAITAPNDPTRRPAKACPIPRAIRPSWWPRPCARSPPCAPTWPP